MLPAPGWSFSGLARLLHRGVGHGNHTVPRFARLPGRRLVSGDPASRSRGSRAPEVLRSRTSRRTRGLYAPEGLSPSPSGTGALQAPEPFRHRSPSGTGVLQTPEAFTSRGRSRPEAFRHRRSSRPEAFTRGTGRRAPPAGATRGHQTLEFCVAMDALVIQGEQSLCGGLARRRGSGAWPSAASAFPAIFGLSGGVDRRIRDAR